MRERERKKERDIERDFSSDMIAVVYLHITHTVPYSMQAFNRFLFSFFNGVWCELYIIVLCLKLHTADQSIHFNG